MIDPGTGDSVGPDAGRLPDSLAAAQADPADIEHVLLTHLHPDHAGGLISPDGTAIFPNATVHAATSEADHWVEAGRVAAAAGLQRLMYYTAVRALAPYRDAGRLVTFHYAGEVIPGVRPVDLSGHTPGHTGYLLGEGDETVLFWGDIVHSHTVQLRRPEVSVFSDSDEAGAVAARWKAFESQRRTDGGWAPPICRSPASAICAAMRTATRGCRSPSHPCPDTRPNPVPGGWCGAGTDNRHPTCRPVLHLSGGAAGDRT
jgi:glyoxylase-like metal-dependent hydrolase (beta-lactamase superfamily II)